MACQCLRAECVLDDLRLTCLASWLVLLIICLVVVVGPRVALLCALLWSLHPFLLLFCLQFCIRCPPLLLRWRSALVCCALQA